MNNCREKGAAFNKVENVYPVKLKQGDGEGEGVPIPAACLTVLTVMFRHRNRVCVLYCADPSALFMFMRVICRILLWLLKQVLNCPHEPELHT